MKKEIIVKKSALVKWELPEVSLNVNEVGYFISISCKNCKNTTLPMMKAGRS